MTSSSLTSEVTGADRAVGYVACILSCIAFGTMFTPLKKYNCRDGMFVMWVQCSVVFLFGFAMNIVRWFPKFEPIAAIGGLLYASGNIFPVPLVKGLGMGPGMLIWGSVQIIVGWSVARFGLFSIMQPAPVVNNVMNYIGVAIVLICGVLFVFVKHKTAPSNEYDLENTDLTAKSSLGHDDCSSNETSRKWSIPMHKLPYVGMAVCLGVVHGFMLCPISILKQREPSEDKYKVLDYIFSFFSGVFFFSTIYFLIYCVVRRQKAYISRELVIPSVGYGILWNIGMILWFISSDKLQQTVSYPITLKLPSIIGALIDVFIFKTIRGRKNVLYLAVVIVFATIGVILIALSNEKL